MMQYRKIGFAVGLVLAAITCCWIWFNVEGMLQTTEVCHGDFFISFQCVLHCIGGNCGSSGSNSAGCVGGNQVLADSPVYCGATGIGTEEIEMMEDVMYLYWISYGVIVLIGWLIDINKTCLTAVYGVGAVVGLFCTVMAAISGAGM